jgi:hypothetical protein
VRQSIENLIAAREKQIAAERQLAGLRRETMAPSQAAADLEQSASMDIANIRNASWRAREGGPGAVEALEAVNRRAYERASDLKEALALRKQELDQQLASRDATIRQVEAQDRLVISAQKALDIEKEKVRAFQAQAGRLSQLEQQQLLDIDAKLKAGKDISRFEEELLDKNGGESGRGVVDARAAKRALPGLDENFLKGVEGAGTGLQDAAKALKEAVEQLKALTGGATAAAKIAELEQEKAALNAAHEELRRTYIKQSNMLHDIIKGNLTRTQELEAAATANAYQ